VNESNLALGTSCRLNRLIYLKKKGNLFLGIF
jgi:hypothetical protein